MDDEVVPEVQQGAASGCVPAGRAVLAGPATRGFS